MSFPSRIGSYITNNIMKYPLNHVTEAGARRFPNLFHYFRGSNANVRVVSYKEMERICERNFDRRIERLFSEKTKNQPQ